jgi:hypothetical protein
MKHARIADTDTTARLLAEAHTSAAQQSASPPLPADTPLSGFLVRCWEARCWALQEAAKGVALYDDLPSEWPRAVGKRDGGLTKAGWRSPAPRPASSTVRGLKAPRR